MDAARPSVVAVVGSPRRDGNTAALVAAVLAELEERGADGQTIVLSGLGIAPCLAHDSCAEFSAYLLGDDAAEVLDRAYTADCLILDELLADARRLAGDLAAALGLSAA